MPLLIGANANSTLEGAEYDKDAYNNSMPEYIDPYERQEWVNLQEQIRSFQEEESPSNIVTNTPNNNKFSWKAFLMHVLHLSGRIQQEYQKIHSLPFVSHQRSGPIIDNGISPYHYYEAPYSNLSDINILYDENTISSSLQNDISTHEQGVSSGTVESEHRDIINKEPKTIDIFESLGEHQHAKSSSNSYIEVDQEVAMPIVVATSTSLMSKEWKYCLGLAGAALAGVGIYAGYKWIMGKIGSSEKEGAILPYDTVEYESQAAMLIGGEKRLGSQIKYGAGIGNIDFSHLSIDDLRDIEARNIHEQPKSKSDITLEVLQYDNIISNNSELGLQDAITSSMDRDFYDRYLHPYFISAYQNATFNKKDNYIILTCNKIGNDLLNVLESKVVDIALRTSFMKNMRHFVNECLGKMNDSKNLLSRVDELVAQHSSTICNNLNIPITSTILFNEPLKILKKQVTDDRTILINIKYHQFRECVLTELYNLASEVQNNIPYYIVTSLQQDQNYCFKQMVEKISSDKNIRNKLRNIWYDIITRNIYDISIAQLALLADIFIECNLAQNIVRMYKSFDYPSTKVMTITPQYIGTISDYSTILELATKKNDNGGSGGVIAPIIPVIPIPPVMLVTPIFAVNMLSFKDILSKYTCRNNAASTSTPDVMVDIPRPQLDESTINQLIQDTIKEELDDLEYQEYSGLDLKDELPQYIRETTVLARNALGEISERFRKSIQILDQFISQDGQNHELQQYLGIALDIDDPSIKLETAKKLREIYQKGKGFLTRSLANHYKNIKIISTIQQSVPGTNNFEFTSQLSESSSRSGAIAFTIPNKEDIYIVADRAYAVNHESLVPYKRYLTDDITETLIHEISHITSNTQDYWYLHKDHFGLIKSVEESSSLLRHRLIRNSRINPIIYDMIAQYSCVNHKNWNGGQLADNTNLNDLLASSPRLKANIIATNADNVVLVLRDLAKMSFVA